MQKVLRYLASVLIMTFLSFLSQDYFFDLSFSQLDLGNVNIITQNIGELFFAQLLFYISMGIIPLLYLIVQEATKLSLSQGLITIGIIVCCGVLAWQARIVQLNHQLQKLAESDSQAVMYIQDLKLGTYLFAGLLIGTIISTLIFRYKKNEQQHRI